ncbi:hypothetical protein RJ55_02166 [Drechmeria coniospora]|nr:hypothetical protein RJ55_02166 [Drechmeria coniospora]
MASPLADATAARSASSLASHLVSPRHARSRSESVSSDKPSTIGLGLGLTTPPLAVSPEPAFIAGPAASQIVAGRHDGHADAWCDQNGIEPASETTTTSPAALHLVNGFLDQLLFHFLQVAKSTHLAALRPAVSEILKPRLADDIIRNADQELREYLGGAHDDEHAPSPESRAWDVELAWKRTRLRCMVYSSLGDFEDDDEDLYVERDNLDVGAHENRADAISPAVAIFLTSVLEYVGELTLTVAGRAAYQRVRAKMESDLRDGTRDVAESADRVVVDDMDVERVALDRTLGRLWRGWKKRMRSPVTDMAGRPYSRGSLSNLSSRPSRQDLPDGSDAGSGWARTSQDTLAEHVLPTDIPLPLGDRDVDEIEVPGLVQYSDDEDEDEDDDVAEPNPAPPRPKSLFMEPFVLVNGLPAASSTAHPQIVLHPPRRRSSSVPSPPLTSFHAVKRSDLQSPRTRTRIGAPDEPTAVDVDAAQLDAIVDADTEVAAVRKRPSTLPLLDTQRKESDSSDDAHEVPILETAEVVTSSRISIAGSSASSISDVSKRSSMKRSSSVRSARIIDVAGPRSPARSRPPSIEIPDRQRPVSLSGLARADAHPPNRFSNTRDHGSRTSMDKKKSFSRQSSVYTSESDDALRRPVWAPESPSTVRSGASTAALPASRHASDQDAATVVEVTPASSAASRDVVQADVNHVTPKAHHPASLTIVDGAPATPPRDAENLNLHSPTADSRGVPPDERLGAKDTDEDISLPRLQTNLPPRHAHTPASSISSVTSRLKPVRDSDDNSSRSESVARNFEELIQSNQTISYTLTPENMRGIDSNRSLDGPVITKVSKKPDDLRGQYPSPRSSPTVADASMPPPTQPLRSPPRSKASESKVGKPTELIPRVPVGRAASATQPGATLTREERAPRDSMTDFATFLKSTGPPADAGPSRKAVSAKGSAPPRRASSGGNFGRFQPREAAIDCRADNSDLIDFIRQGPPSASNGHRIPRNVAPFRTTMDSDQMSNAIGGKAIDAMIPDIRHSQASTNLTDTSMPSMQSSVNSSSALLKSKSPAATPKLFDEGGLIPRRKQTRVRDPYAIEYSDEEDDDDYDDDDDDDDDAGMAGSPRYPPIKKEESLAEFLRNYDPPPEPLSAAARVPKKKTSSPSLIGKFGRVGSREGRDPLIPSEEALSPNGRVGGRNGHIPIQVNMPTGYDKYGSTDPPVSSSRIMAPPSAGSRVPRKKFEPREAATSRMETSDLAAFLRDSAPPETGAGAGGPAAKPSLRPEESGSSISRIFGRRKKSGVA